MHTDCKRIDIVLQPGEFFVGHAGHTLRTLLGSCVSITLWHPLRKIGAMSHFLLPTRGVPVPPDLDGRYGDEAMQLMLRELARHDVRATECKAKIFGGARMFPGQIQTDESHIGHKNGAAARALLCAHRIEIASENLFGFGHRQILFDVNSGDVWARQIPPSDPYWQEQQ